MYTASVITVSDRAASVIYEDKSGPAIREMLKRSDYKVVNSAIVPDDAVALTDALTQDIENGVNLILTTGGTGFSERDITPEVTRGIITKEAQGIAEYMRMKSMEITPAGMLSRGVAGICRSSLIVNLPGSPKGAVENLGFVLPSLKHGLDMLNGRKEP